MLAKRATVTPASAATLIFLPIIIAGVGRYVYLRKIDDDEAERKGGEQQSEKERGGWVGG